jgi:hypothetical protein
MVFGEKCRKEIEKKIVLKRYFGDNSIKTTTESWHLVPSHTPVGRKKTICVRHRTALRIETALQ